MAQKQLEKEGYTVDNKAGMAYWAKNRDYFHVFDLLAKKFNEPLRWISIKGTQGLIKSHLAEIEGCWMPEGNTKEFWAAKRNPKSNRFIGWNKLIVENNNKDVNGVKNQGKKETITATPR